MVEASRKPGRRGPVARAEGCGVVVVVGGMGPGRRQEAKNGGFWRRVSVLGVERVREGVARLEACEWASEDGWTVSP